MRFDKSKVLSVLSDNNLDYKGWRGYFSGSVIALKQYVEKDDRSYLGNYDRLCEVYEDAPHDMTFMGSEIGVFSFFYPIEEPKPKETWRPYKNLTEMACELNHLMLQEQFSEYALIRHLVGRIITKNGIIFSITGINCKENIILICNEWMGMEELYHSDWMWVDSNAETTKRCGVGETNQEE